MRILITGGTGFIGKAVCARLGGENEIIAVSRDAQRAAATLGGTARPATLPATVSEWRAAVDGCDAVINLAGESIAGGRWTETRKRQMTDSRVGLTRALAQGIQEAEHKPSVLISASGVGYYGAHGDEVLDEASPPGRDFLARVCVDWEQATEAAEAAGVRTVHLRIGLVLGRHGGALQSMATPFKFYLGGHVGSGKQWVSWIHLDDVVGLIAHVLGASAARGAVNATAPEQQTMRDFCRTLGKVLGRPSWAPVPGAVLKLALGEMADLMLTGQRVTPAAALALGYRFAHPELEEALRASL